MNVMAVVLENNDRIMSHVQTILVNCIQGQGHTAQSYGVSFLAEPEPKTARNERDVAKDLVDLIQGHVQFERVVVSIDLSPAAGAFTSYGFCVLEFAGKELGGYGGVGAWLMRPDHLIVVTTSYPACAVGGRVMDGKEIICMPVMNDSNVSDYFDMRDKGTVVLPLVDRGVLGAIPMLEKIVTLWLRPSVSI